MSEGNIKSHRYHNEQSNTPREEGKTDEREREG